mmetsp:Transcript_16177/g.24642  ORF Transcript_16177/g.24642 Transcript_16177/m.24642 type:complete len:85 (+) Transcript_16177:38-292(+)
MTNINFAPRRLKDDVPLQIFGTSFEVSGYHVVTLNERQLTRSTVWPKTHHIDKTTNRLTGYCMVHVVIGHTLAHAFVRTPPLIR